MSDDGKVEVHPGNFSRQHSVSYAGIGALGHPRLIEVEALVKKARDEGAPDTATLHADGVHSRVKWITA